MIDPLWLPKKLGSLWMDLVFGKAEDFHYVSTTTPAHGYVQDEPGEWPYSQ